MAGVTVFQDHHVIERQAVDKSALLQNLVKQRLFNGARSSMIPQIA